MLGRRAGALVLAAAGAATVCAAGPAHAAPRRGPEPAGDRAAETDAGRDADRVAGRDAGRDARRDRRGGSSFSKGVWEFHFTGGYYNDISPSDETIVHGAAGFGYYFADRLAVNVQLAGFALDPNDPGESNHVPGGGFDLLLRWHVLEYGRVTLFAEGGIGLIYSDKSIPQFGTHFNFTPQAALGATFRVYDNVHLIGAAKYFHLSNAAMQGRDDNPGLDALGGYVGVMWTF